MGFFVLLCVAVVMGGCREKQAASALSFVAQAFTNHSCAACKMIIREQSSPRGQVIHRDGKRQYFCSISDMLHYLGAPSPHGRVKAVYVETMEPSLDPKKFSTQARPWRKAADAFYVLGFPKPRVMGTPILVYQDKRQAQRWARSPGASVHDWKSLRAQWKRKTNQ